MALNIKDAETDRLARRLAELTGTSLTDAVHQALQARLDWVIGKERLAHAPLSSSMQDILDRAAAGRAALSDRAEDDILGYDEQGLPA